MTEKQESEPESEVCSECGELPLDCSIRNCEDVAYKFRADVPSGLRFCVEHWMAIYLESQAEYWEDQFETFQEADMKADESPPWGAAGGSCDACDPWLNGSF